MQGIEQAKKQAAEEIWLSYFNEQAYAAGLIDEKTRNRIRVALVLFRAKKQGKELPCFFVYIYRCNRR